MSNYNFNPSEDFTPVDVTALGGLSVETGATFSLSPAQVTDDGTATFNLTPSMGGDGMTFNLTPVLQSPMEPHQFSSIPPELDMDSLGPGSLASQVMAFSPPLQVTSSTLTPDFTGLLPPPPPQVTPSAPLHPAPLLASVLSSPESGGAVHFPSHAPPPYMEQYSPARPYLPPSQLSLLLSSPPPPPYKSPPYPPSQPLLLSPQHFQSDNVLRIAPSVTLTKKPPNSTSPGHPQCQTSPRSAQGAPPQSPGPAPQHPAKSPHLAMALQSAVSPRRYLAPAQTSPLPLLKAQTSPLPLLKAQTSPLPLLKAQTSPLPLLKGQTSPRPPTIRTQTSPRPHSSAVSPRSQTPHKAPHQPTSIMVPHQSASLMAPHHSTSPMAPHQSSPIMAPHQSASLMAPHHSTSPTAPHQSASLTAPNNSTSPMAPYQSASPMAPHQSASLMAPHHSTTHMAPHHSASTEAPQPSTSTAATPKMSTPSMDPKPSTSPGLPLPSGLPSPSCILQSPVAPHTEGPRLPKYSLEELQDLPGVNLKKGSVDLSTYVSAVARNMHPQFANVDSYAERCLACIVRKIRSSLPTLKALEDITLTSRSGSKPDPGCILVPRMKDGRITIARPGGGAGGTKKIHPHLALVQIFKDPSVVNHNSLMPTAACSRPFQGESDLVCISPLHYTVEGRKAKLPASPKKRISLPDSLEAGEQSMTRDFQPPFPGQKPSLVKPPVVAHEADLLSDSDDDGVDWVAKWDTESVAAKSAGIQEFDEEAILRQVELLCLASQPGGQYVPADQAIVREMRVREDLLMLLKGKYDLTSLKDAVKPRPVPTKQPPAVAKVVKRAYVRKAPLQPKPAKKKAPGEAWVNEAQALLQAQPAKMIQRPEASAQPVQIKTEEDETVIQSLLDDIKGSFESQFEMDLDPFGASVGPAFSQDFGMSSAFSLASFDDSSFESATPPSRELFPPAQTAPAGVTQLNTGVTSVSSDAMFSGAGLVEDPAPGFPRGFGQEEFLSPADSLSQEQFLKMFDNDD